MSCRFAAGQGIIFLITIFLKRSLMQKINFSRFAGILVFCLFTLAQNAFAQATLSIQGIIQKSNGAAVDDGSYDLIFKLYPSNSGGTAVHTEAQTVAVAGGIYSAELGGGTTPLSAAFDQTYYLGVSVSGGAELIPRSRLTSSPYALSLLGTTNLFPSSGAIGAGTIAPTSGYLMHIKSASGAGKLLIEGSTAGQVDFKKGNSVGSVGFGTANSDFVVNPGANNTTLQYNGTTKLSVTTNGATVAGTLDATTLSGATVNGTTMTGTTVNGTTMNATTMNATTLNATNLALPTWPLRQNSPSGRAAWTALTTLK